MEASIGTFHSLLAKGHCIDAIIQIGVLLHNNKTSSNCVLGGFYCWATWSIWYVKIQQKLGIWNSQWVNIRSYYANQCGLASGIRLFLGMRLWGRSNLYNNMGQGREYLTHLALPRGLKYLTAVWLLKVKFFFKITHLSIITVNLF